MRHRVRTGVVVAALAACSALLSAQQPVSITSKPQDVATATAPGNQVRLRVAGYGSVGFDIVGTFTATIQFEASYQENCGTYRSLNVTPPNSTTAVTSATAAGSWVGVAAGATCVRARMSAYTSGTATIEIRATVGGGSGGGGASPTLGGTGGDISASLDNIETYTQNLQNMSPDAVHGNNIIPTGPGIQCEAINFDASAAPNTVTEGQSARVKCNTSGILEVFLVNADGTKQLGKLEDDAHASADYGMPVWAKRTTTAAVSSGTDADYSTVNVDDLGLLWSRQLDPCSGVAKTYIPINISSATTTELTASLAGASNHYYVCTINLVTAAANNVALADDDTDNCGSVTSGLAGGTTAASGWNFAANGGLTLGSGASSVMRTAGTNRVLCLVTSAATQLSGHIAVVAAP